MAELPYDTIFGKGESFPGAAMYNRYSFKADFFKKQCCVCERIGNIILMVCITADGHWNIFFMKNFKDPWTWISCRGFLLINPPGIHLDDRSARMNCVNGFFYFVLIPRICLTKEFSFDVLYFDLVHMTHD